MTFESFVFGQVDPVSGKMSSLVERIVFGSTGEEPKETEHGAKV